MQNTQYKLRIVGASERTPLGEYINVFTQNIYAEDAENSENKYKMTLIDPYKHDKKHYEEDTNYIYSGEIIMIDKISEIPVPTYYRINDHCTPIVDIDLTNNEILCDFFVVYKQLVLVKNCVESFYYKYASAKKNGFVRNN